jgi:hypothetical protein
LFACSAFNVVRRPSSFSSSFAKARARCGRQSSKGGSPTSWRVSRAIRSKTARSASSSLRGTSRLTLSVACRASVACLTQRSASASSPKAAVSASTSGPARHQAAGRSRQRPPVCVSPYAAARHGPVASRACARGRHVAARDLSQDCWRITLHLVVRNAIPAPVIAPGKRPLEASRCSAGTEWQPASLVAVSTCACEGPQLGERLRPSAPIRQRLAPAAPAPTRDRGAGASSS